MIRARMTKLAIGFLLLLLLTPLSAVAEDDPDDVVEVSAELRFARKEPADAPDPTPEPAQAEKAEDPPGDAGSEPQPQTTPQAPESNREYELAWADGAFRFQTRNYTDELVIGLGAGYQLDPARDILITRAGEPLDARPKSDIHYSSSNTKCLSVNASGRIIGKKKGSAQICVTVTLPGGGQKQLRKDVKVVDQPSIGFAPNSAVVENGGTLDLGQYAKVPLITASPNVNAGIRYALAARPKSKISKVSLDKATGKLSVEYAAPGDAYVITATTYAGQEARFTLYLGKRAKRVDIASGSGMADPSGRPVVKSGESLELRAAAYDADGALAARQDVLWRLEGADAAASIDDRGVLRAAAGLNAETTVTVVATAVDGSEARGKLNVILVP